MLIRDSGIKITKDHPEYKTTLEYLTRKITTWYGLPSILKLYLECENGIVVPRFYPIDDQLQDNTEIGLDIDIKSNVVPKNKRQSDSINFLTSNRNGILKLEPGTGKTVLTIDSICKIGKKAIILVHKLELMKQWIEELLRFTNIKEEDIGVLRSSNYSTELQKPIIISTVQTIVSLLKKDGFSKELESSKIGVAIFDESHTTVGPEVFSKVSFNLNCHRIFGLSATPIRFDNSDILEYHLGKITYFEPEEGELLKPLVYICYFPFGIYKRYRQYIMWGGKFQYSRYEKQMIKIDSYFDIVSDLIISARKKDNRTILVLGKRVDSLLKLATMTQIDKEDIGIFISSAKDSDKLKISNTCDLSEAFKSKKCIFATYGMARDGNNRKDLDCLIMTLPTGNIVQAVGRICRPLEGKRQPIVLDLVDTEGPKEQSLNLKDADGNLKQVGMFIKSSEKRIELYKELGWDYKFVNIENRIKNGN